ncbi:hypothetical protein BMF35_a1848 [Aurantiacibacter gangjinensis]|nr:hypothetical protein BMF35_a1848 [Aurantiacibacter gangjinensis]
MPAGRIVLSGTTTLPVWQVGAGIAAHLEMQSRNGSKAPLAACAPERKCCRTCRHRLSPALASRADEIPKFQEVRMVHGRHD